MNSLMTSRTQAVIGHGRRILGSPRLQHHVGLTFGHGASAPGVSGTVAIPHTLSRVISQVPVRIPTTGSKAGVEGGRGALLLGRVLAGVAVTAAACFWLEDERVALALGAYGLPVGDKYPRICHCFIEVSRESRMKYEWNEAMNMLKLDRVLHGAAFYPHDYGFIPQTLCGDGDPLDVMVLGTSALQPGAIVDIRPLGYMVMEDEKGLDEKVLAVPAKDPRDEMNEGKTVHGVCGVFHELLHKLKTFDSFCRFNHMNSLRDVPEHVLREISNFFETYKQLERSKWVKVGGWKGTEDTHDLIESTHKSYLTVKKDEAQMKVIA